MSQSHEKNPECVYIAVTGGRGHVVSKKEEDVFFELAEEIRLRSRKPYVVLLHGACPAQGSPRTDEMAWALRGVDRWVHLGVIVHGGLKDSLRAIIPYPPKQLTIGWPHCGPERNKRMIKSADALIAFPGGRGTSSTVKTALVNGVPVLLVRKDSIWPCPLCRMSGFHKLDCRPAWEACG